MMVETQPPYDYDEPQLERSRPRSRICAKPAALVLSQVIQHEGVAVHDGVVVAAHEAHDPENPVGVGTNKTGPRVISRCLGPGKENRRQLRGGYCGHAGSLVAHVHDLILNHRT
jgi:hypothetical protein